MFYKRHIETLVIRRCTSNDIARIEISKNGTDSAHGFLTTRRIARVSKRPVRRQDAGHTCAWVGAPGQHPTSTVCVARTIYNKRSYRAYVAKTAAWELLLFTREQTNRTTVTVTIITLRTSPGQRTGIKMICSFSAIGQHFRTDASRSWLGRRSLWHNDACATRIMIIRKEDGRGEKNVKRSL
jgi:hypothetical protein